MKSIPHNKPFYDECETFAVSKVLKSAFVAKGLMTEQFQNNFTEYLNNGKGYSFAVSSGTAALYVALLSLQLPSNSKIVVPSYVCSALLNALFMHGLQPVVADVDPVDFNISYESVSRVFSSRISALIVPHIFGVPADIGRLKDFGVPIIEDCAHSMQSKIANQNTGTLGDVSMFSFYASKYLSTGTGGMIFTKNKIRYKRITNYLKFDYVKKYSPKFNFDYNDIQAAIGIEQIKKISYFNCARQKIAGEYSALFTEKGIDFQRCLNENMRPNFYRFVIKDHHKNIERIKARLEKKGVKTIIPIEKFELLHNYLGLDRRKFPNAEKISKTTLSIPIYPELYSSGNFEYVLSELKKV